MIETKIATYKDLDDALECYAKLFRYNETLSKLHADLEGATERARRKFFEQKVTSGNDSDFMNSFVNMDVASHYRILMIYLNKRHQACLPDIEVK